MFLSIVVLLSALALSNSFRSSTSSSNFRSSTSSSSFRSSASSPTSDSGDGEALDRLTPNGLDYDFYREQCPSAEAIVRSSMTRFYSDHRNVSAGLLRLLFHDCFVQGCDASVFLDDSNGNKSHSIERQAIPNLTLRGFDTIHAIKEELESKCPGVVSCADILALATRDGVVLAGGPFYPVLTGRRDSNESFFLEANDQIPSPFGNVSETLRHFASRGFNEKETVILSGAHNIGKISCDFIQARLEDFNLTGKPDQSIAPDFLNELRLSCEESGNSNKDESSTLLRLRRLRERESTLGMTNSQGFSASIFSGTGFDSHYFRSLLRGRGLLFSDQQLMADERTARWVRRYAMDDGSLFRVDFARAMVKLSILGSHTGSGLVRLNCSLPVAS